MKEYYTQMEAAKKGIITPEMEIVAVKEDMDIELLRERVAQGVIAIPCNVRHTSISPEGIGMGLRTKINVNLGISGDRKEVHVIDSTKCIACGSCREACRFDAVLTERRPA